MCKLLENFASSGTSSGCVGTGGRVASRYGGRFEMKCATPVLRYMCSACMCVRVIEIKALSHQGYPLTYELMTESGSQSNEFAIDHSSGVVDLLRILDYEKDPQQYHLRVKVIENGRPARTSTVNVRDGDL